MAGNLKSKDNKEIARILRATAEYLAMDEIPFKPQAYARAARSLEELEARVDDIYREGGIKALEKIPGVGASIAEKIEEFIKTGRVKYYEDCLLYTSPSPRDLSTSRMPSSA